MQKSNERSPVFARFPHGSAQGQPTRRIRVLGVPLDMGASRRGVDMGPSAMRVAGLEAPLPPPSPSRFPGSPNTTCAGFLAVQGVKLSRRGADSNHVRSVAAELLAAVRIRKEGECD